MSGRGSRVRAARLLCAAAAGSFVPFPLAAQTIPTPSAGSPQAQSPPDAAELDPNAPLAPLPDLGVGWPDLDPKGTAAPPPPTISSRKSSRPAIAAGVGDIRYTVEVKGLDTLGNAEDVLRGFRQSLSRDATFLRGIRLNERPIYR